MSPFVLSVLIQSQDAYLSASGLVSVTLELIGYYSQGGQTDSTINHMGYHAGGIRDYGYSAPCWTVTHILHGWNVWIKIIFLLSALG